MVNDRDDTDASSLASDSIASESTDSYRLYGTSSAVSAMDEPLSAEMLVARIGPHIYWEAAHHLLAGSDAISMVPDEWRMPLVETFNPRPPVFEPHGISPTSRTLYVEAQEALTTLRIGDSSSFLPLSNDTNLIEVSLNIAVVSKSLQNTLDALPRWINECYRPLMRCAFHSNDLIEDVTLHLPSPPGERLCEDVFQDETLSALQTETIFVPAALRLSKVSLNSAIPVPSEALDAAQVAQLSPRYSVPGQIQNLELFSTLFDWHPHHLGIKYQDNGNSHPGLWRHGRMAATSLTRHLHWLGIHAPVIVVQFDFEKVAFHVNWPQFYEGRLRCTSAPVAPPGASISNPRCSRHLKWLDLRKPAEAVEVGLILANIDYYTSRHFQEEVRRQFTEGASSYCSSRPWKIDTSVLPRSMTEVEGSREWRENQDIQYQRTKVPQYPPDIRSWLQTVH